MPLTNLLIQRAKARDKAYKLFDGRGLFLLVSPNGSKGWRFKYRFQSKEKLLSLGTYPEISLADARDRLEEFRKLVAKGIDPSEYRKLNRSKVLEKSANSFEAVALEWLAKNAASWSIGHKTRLESRLTNDVFPLIGNQPVADINARQVLQVVRKIEERGAIESAHRALSNCSQIMRYAVQTARAERDPCIDLRGALPSVKTRHLAAIVKPEEIGALLLKLSDYRGSHVVRSALKIAPLVFVRPGELRHAKWRDVDLESAEWRFVVTKTNTEHIVPLAKQAVATLRELYLFTSSSEFVFPGARSITKPMSENAVLAALRALDIPKEDMSGHGFRAMARTILEEELGFRPELIEHQLAHSVRDPLGRAYNRTTHLDERKRMMQEWADWLDKTHERQKEKNQ